MSLTLEERDVQEEFFARGWTDGLPIVPPTPKRVKAMLQVAGAADPQVLIGFLAARGRGVSLEKAAINAVMAGCKPEYFPVVVAALEAMFDPAFSLHLVLTSTSGAGLCTVVSGPLAAELGLNARSGVFGPGNRANATIGRALRLVAMNVLAARPEDGDASSFGHPGKFTFCFAEDPPPDPWQPLHVAAGYGGGDTVVAVLPSEGPHQVAQQLTSSPESILRTTAAAIGNPAWFSAGKRGQGVLVLGPEHAGFCVAAGWTQAAVRDFVYRESRISPEQLLAAGVELEQGAGHDMTPGPDGLLDTLASPDALLLVTAGREGSGWSAWIPNSMPIQHTRATLRRVRLAGEPLPDCGPDGCLVPSAATG
jgi:hypothetical protein